MQLQVIVNKLNRRKSPVTDIADKSNVVGVLKKDAFFESVGEINNVLGTWYVDRDGFWAWEKGLSRVVAIPQSFLTEVVFSDYFNLTFIPEKMSWAHQLLEIPLIWKDIETAGKDIVVGIIDTGIDVSHDDLKSSFLTASIHVDNDGIKDETSDINQRIQDSDGHGTEMAGIIGAVGKRVYGIAPQCKLLVVKLDGTIGRSALSIATSINYLVSNNVDVISISQSAPDEPVLKNAIAQSLLNKIPVFAAIGNNHTSINPIDADTFPACYEGCVAVGAFDEDKNVCNFSQRNPHLTFLAPGSKNTILTSSIGNNVIKCRGQTSIATAISTACFALIISFLKKNNRLDLKDAALRQLILSCDDMGNVINHDPDHGFGRINLRNAISRIKNLL